MKRVAVPARPDWVRTAQRLGFAHHSWWVDAACYRFERHEIERELRPAVDEIWGLCLQVVERASRDDEVLATLGIPEPAWEPLRASWLRRDPALMTRFDLAFGDGGPAKLHECNGDTPGILFEAALFQWLWLEDQIARGAVAADCDQFNRLHSALVAALGRLPPGHLHVAATPRNIEDMVQAAYLADCARQAGRGASLVGLEEIGLGAIGRDGVGILVGADDRRIGRLAKVYRWELLLREPFGRALTGQGAPLVLEPLWKLVLASKGLLVWLWRMFPRHPNLLPCWFEGDPAAPDDRIVRKPLFSIKGKNVSLRDSRAPGGGEATGGPYGGERRVVQALHYLPTFEDRGSPVRATVGAWVIDGRAEGIGVLEDRSPIIRDETSFFVPHLVAD